MNPTRAPRFEELDRIIQAEDEELVELREEVQRLKAELKTAKKLARPLPTLEERQEQLRKKMARKNSRDDQVKYEVLKSALSPKFLPPPSVQILIEQTANEYGIPVTLLASNRHFALAVQARRRVIRILRESGYSLPMIGRYLNIHHTSVFYLLKKKPPEKALTL
jgi:chromosomal replication initiation ATPase DnaA